MPPHRPVRRGRRRHGGGEGGVGTVKAGIDAWAPRSGTVLDRMRQWAPHTEVSVIGCGDYVRPGGCFPARPSGPSTPTAPRARWNHLGAAPEQAARAYGATFVDTYPLGVGHDACAAPADRYTEGPLPTHIAIPPHPNA
ncbi:hypothetical protein ACFV6E_17560 [Streptomyces sp. NPDC059785]|uniref:hypothetical protein n=1 Tax=unclassified Streptomyces TaxID=2593676 RepID=UPI00366403F5